MPIRKFTIAIACAVVSMMAVDVKADVVLGSFDFTDNSLAFTDADAGDGITISSLGINGFTTDELFSDNGDAVADNTLDYASLSGTETSSGTGDGFAAGEYLSITITNNSGSLLGLRSLSGDFRKNNVFQLFTGRIFNTTTPAAVVADTIAKLGREGGGSDPDFVNDVAFLDGTDGDAGATFIAVPITIADGSALMLHWLPTMNSSSDTRSMAIDNFTITSTAVAVPEPTSLALLGVASLGLCSRRRKS